jgi:signal transduction histidine kinase
VLTRRLDQKLLGAFGVVCLVLMLASLAGALFLSRLHSRISVVLTENVDSTQVAADLETTTKDLISLLRGSGPEAGSRTGAIEERNLRVRGLLERAEMLANHPEEEDAVRQITDGLDDYFQRWSERPSVDRAKAQEYDARLAALLESDVLPHCIKLSQFNLGQIKRSEQDNRDFVNTLKWGVLAVGMGGSLGGLILGFTVARRLRHSIGQLSVRIRDAAGRLNREVGSVTVEEQGDLPDLHRQMQIVLEEISRTVDQLQQREHEVLRAEQLSAVGQIAAGVAHELRNPLTAIKMLVQTGLEGESPPGLPAEDLSVIEQSVRRMEQYIQVFLDFARPPRCERRRSDLLVVVRRAVALVEGRARRQKVNLELDLPEQPVPASIDPEQIQQVLVNLLLNALDALPTDGLIQIEVETGDSIVTVRVRDDGPGVPPAIRSRLFEPFITSKPEGVGLGLSICKRLVEAHGGTIDHDCPGPDGGAAVTFTLPLEEEAHALVAGRG